MGSGFARGKILSFCFSIGSPEPLLSSPELRDSLDLALNHLEVHDASGISLGTPPQYGSATFYPFQFDD
jgi:hypothetical protein